MEIERARAVVDGHLPPLALLVHVAKALRVGWVGWGKPAAGAGWGLAPRGCGTVVAAHAGGVSPGLAG